MARELCVVKMERELCVECNLYIRMRPEENESDALERLRNILEYNDIEYAVNAENETGEFIDY